MRLLDQRRRQVLKRRAIGGVDFNLLTILIDDVRAHFCVVRGNQAVPTHLCLQVFTEED